MNKKRQGCSGVQVLHVVEIRCIQRFVSQDTCLGHHTSTGISSVARQLKTKNAAVCNMRPCGTLTPGRSGQDGALPSMRRRRGRALQTVSDAHIYPTEDGDGQWFAAEATAVSPG
eukprot:GGOE01025571.1.p1 GENE.GGOE01025571.1~~GGOE01025571.1.p1  ORF type:complete len:115 (+),score=10.66 GGOE01025571.1:100-444(+)